MSKKIIVISGGDPAGCGPQIIVAALRELVTKKQSRIQYQVVGDACIFQRLPQFCDIAPHIHFIDAATPGIGSLRFYSGTRTSGQAALGYLDIALRQCRDTGAALVTAPVSKEAIGLLRPGFCGHTEYIASHYQVKHYAMMMSSSALKIVLCTRHIPLAEVSGHLKTAELCMIFRMIYKALRIQCAIDAPRIAAASCNPHAGLDTFCGREERRVIAAIKKSRVPIQGPFPADTLFIPAHQARFDCILCMYHDQGMIPFKILAFTQGVNVTLGLPIVRTSPAHGTAYGLMQSGGTPSHQSMRAAIQMAASLRPFI